MSQAAIHPADLLARAAAMVHFLAEITPALGESGSALSDQSSFGLILILNQVEDTINQAAEQL